LLARAPPRGAAKQTPAASPYFALGAGGRTIGALGGIPGGWFCASCISPSGLPALAAVTLGSTPASCSLSSFFAAAYCLPFCINCALLFLRARTRSCYDMLRWIRLFCRDGYQDNRCATFRIEHRDAHRAVDVLPRNIAWTSFS
jgi:hypothetical protein